jgi:ribosomal-protein-alanine N-acetyltransferase
MKEPEFSMRAATPGDAGVLAALDAACLVPAWTPDALEAALHDEKYVVLLAQNGAEIPGFALAYLVGEEAEFARLGVLSSWRKRGIGEQLVRASMQALKQRGAREIFLEVREDNEAARRLYARLGFEEIAHRSGYYDDGENAIVMRARLAPTHALYRHQIRSSSMESGSDDRQR